MNIQCKYRQAGFSLTEALVAFAVVTGGLLAVASFQGNLFVNSAYNKARTEALSLAQEKIEEFRHYTFADEDNFIDDNLDGLMDADGDYQEASIAGNNANFVRSWNLITDGESKRVNVTVSWVDAANETQSVALASSLAFQSPRSGADQLSDVQQPLVASPTGRAEMAEGSLDDYPSAVRSSSPGADGLSTYQYQEDLFLVNPDNRVVLRLRDACSSTSGVCTEFVKISGTVYLDVTNMEGNTDLQAPDIFVTASDSAYCQRWSDSGSLETPSTTANGNYKYFNYACYFGGGWFGNIGFVTSVGLKLTDKICLGDPTSLYEPDQTVISFRRAYRGMLQYTAAGGRVEYFTHGIKDGTQMTGHDFVFTYLPADRTEGVECVGTDGPMTRTDSAGGKLFTGVPADFVCLNDDDNVDRSPDYLDFYDTNRFTANVGCPFDPTDPPVLSHLISGTVSVASTEALDLSAFDVVSSDGAGTCTLASDFVATASGYAAKYACTVWDWGSGWTGAIQLRPNSTEVYCASDKATFTDLMSDQAQNFSCTNANTITIGGSIIYQGVDAPVTAVSIIGTIDPATVIEGVCEWTDSAYQCKLPYKELSPTVTLKVATTGYVCGATDGVFTFTGLSNESQLSQNDIVVAADLASCSFAVLEPAL